jgi:hypothetical protein
MLLILELLFFVIAIYYLGKGFYKKNSAEVSSLSIKNYQYTATVWFLVFGLIGFYLIDYFIVGVLAKNLILIGYFGLVVFILQKRVFSTNFKPEESFFKVAKGFLILSSCLAILIVGLILASLVFESYHFFTKVNIFDFLFGTKWNPIGSKIFQISTHASKLKIGNAFAGVHLVFPDREGPHVGVQVSKKEDLHSFFFK